MPYNRQDQWRAVPTPAWHLYGAAPCEDMTWQWPLETLEKTWQNTPESLATFTEIHSVFRSSGVTALKDVTSDNKKTCSDKDDASELDSGFWILDSVWFQWIFVSWLFMDGRQRREMPQTVSDDSDDNDGLAWITSERPRWSRFLRQNWGQGPLEGQRVYECLWIYMVFICEFVIHVSMCMLAF